MCKIGIIVVGYNRVESISRCIARLEECSYSTEVNLHISIDNGIVNQDVVSAADDFFWSHGKKIVHARKERYGLKKHIFACGEIVNEYGYDGIIMLEDDIFVADDFYNYVIQCMEKYKDNTNISGISLYQHNWNIDAKLPFEPINMGYDIFFMQYAQSWGQAWSKRMWNNFIEWYKLNEEWNTADVRIPPNVLMWSDQSWLKYFIKYTIDSNTYFVYPYVSLSTNYTDVGEHNKESNVYMQRQLFFARNHEYRLPDFDVDAVKYDAFFESVNLLSLLKKDISIDLFGRKNSMNNRYLLTTKLLNYKIISEYSLYLKPIELNVICNQKGKGIYLYDTHEHCEQKRYNYDLLFAYHWRNYDVKKCLKHIIKLAKNKVKNRIK